MNLIVGLGNPGKEYIRSRHNTGFVCVDHIARKWGIKLSQRRANVELGEGLFGDFPVVLARPRTNMNQSGEAVKYLVARYRASAADLIIIYDDMDIPVGKTRIRPGGSTAGHKGIDSIIDRLSTQEFPRVRVGIGLPPPGVDGAEYVLRPFLSEERSIIDNIVERVADAVECVLQEGIQTAMSKFN